MHFSKETPVLIVDELGPSLHFWVDRLGFHVAMRAPDDDFAQVVHGEVAIMLQTKGALREDIPHLAHQDFCSFLYIEVPDVEQIVPVVADTHVVEPLRRAPYGMHEIFVRAPGGHIVGFGSPIREA